MSARFVWTVGCVFFVVHVLGAYDVFYKWSHARALEMTTMQTVVFTGIETGMGLYLNFLFGLVWIADTAWWWMKGDEGYRRRGRKLFFLEHAFLLFMMFNGAFVFVTDWPRWLGLAMVLTGLLGVAGAGIRMKHQVATISPQ